MTHYIYKRGCSVKADEATTPNVTEVALTRLLAAYVTHDVDVTEDALSRLDT